MIKDQDFKRIIEEVSTEIDFSGAIYMTSEEGVFQAAFGEANRAEKLKNTISTRFGIASGCKLFTAIAICQLVEKGLLSFQTKLKDCLDIPFPHFHEDITIHQLLTHTSGIQDYFDETVMDDFEDLWKERPVYSLRSVGDFLPMIQNNGMKYEPGETFHYNNAGFLILGLVIEQQSGQSFVDYVESDIFRQCGMNDSGYFSLDRLPENTAYGYIDEQDGTWRTNVYSIPVQGGPDGGAFITPPDMTKLWKGLLSYQLISEEHTKLLLTPHVLVKEDVYYGYGIWINKKNEEVFKYHVMGYDPGVSFHSSYYPQYNCTLVVPSNKSSGAFPITKAIENNL